MYIIFLNLAVVKIWKIIIIISYIYVFCSYFCLSSVLMAAGWLLGCWAGLRTVVSE